MPTHRLLHLLLLSAALGLAISAYALGHHFEVLPGTICTFGDTFNCDTVNRGPLSEIATIPVAALGVFGFFMILVGALLKYRTQDDHSLSVFLLFSSSLGFAFSLYLTFLEAFVLHAWCLLCLVTFFAITTAFVCSLVLFLRDRRPV